MEKRRPTYDLGSVKAVLGDVGTLAITRTALSGAYALGFDRAGIADVIKSIQPPMFIKSMTTYINNKIWQDVYFVPVNDLTLYIKIQKDVVTEFQIMSFKEK